MDELATLWLLVHVWLFSVFSWSYAKAFFITQANLKTLFEFRQVSVDTWPQG